MFAFVQYDDTTMMKKNDEKYFQIKREFENIEVDENSGKFRKFFFF